MTPEEQAVINAAISWFLDDTTETEETLDIAIDNMLQERALRAMTTQTQKQETPHD